MRALCGRLLVPRRSGAVRVFARPVRRLHQPVPRAGHSVIVVCLKTVGRRTRTPGLLLAEGLVSKTTDGTRRSCWPDPGVELSKERLHHIYHAWIRLSVR